MSFTVPFMERALSVVEACLVNIHIARLSYDAG